jgi:hypothetical protein
MEKLALIFTVVVLSAVVLGIITLIISKLDSAVDPRA